MSRRAFGSVRKLASGRWQASYWHDGRRHIGSLTYRAKADASAWLAAVEADIRRGAWVDPRAGRLSVRELGGTWLGSNPAKRASTQAVERDILRLHVEPALGHRRIDSVTPADVQEFVNGLSRRLGARSVRRSYGVLRAMFGFAVNADWLVRSPCRGIKLPPLMVRSRRALSAADIAGLAAAVGVRHAPVVYLGALLGLRWSEIAGLRVRAIDLGRGILVVKEARVRTAHHEQVSGPPKSEAGRRSLTMPRALIDILTAHLRNLGEGANDPDAYVFHGSLGQPLDYVNWRRRVWLPACEATGLVGDRLPRPAPSGCHRAGGHRGRSEDGTDAPRAHRSADDPGGVRTGDDRRRPAGRRARRGVLPRPVTPCGRKIAHGSRTAPFGPSSPKWPQHL